MKIFLYLVFALTISLCNVAYSQEESEESTEYSYEEQEPEGIIKAFNGDIGYFGPAGLSLAAGFRYWFDSFTIGISGISNNIPNYSYYNSQFPINPNLPLPNGYDEKSYPALIVTGDFAYHYKIMKKITAFASLGFYSQQDTVLAWDYTDNFYYYYKHKASAGVCFGIGAEYTYQQNLNIGLGYHTKRGLFARLTYYWY